MNHPSPSSQRDLFFPPPRLRELKCWWEAKEGTRSILPVSSRYRLSAINFGVSALIIKLLKLQDSPSWSWISQHHQHCTLPRWQGRRGQIVEHGSQGDKGLSIGDWCKPQPARRENWGVKELTSSLGFNSESWGFIFEKRFPKATAL